MIDPTYVVGLAQTLNSVMASDTSKYVIDSVKTFKGGKDKEATIVKYEELINDLISENQELKRVALGYKEEYEKINITDDNIEYLRNTFNRVLELISNMGENEDDDKTKKDMEQFTSLIDVDTLKTMQLLGFNYKQAIGEPLTLIVNDFITRMYRTAVSSNSNSNYDIEISSDSEETE
ncbi:YybS family protein [Planococcus sp. A6]|uniref:hypothetical protein n=1 Tax=Planococcus sp. A6 TaxID=2992760 RepID=UPI00237B036E|nr:hypothetical protein [Planococcus sp. A6]MDE0584697.1 YybS family protein [Planococcus sp. A6]